MDLGLIRWSIREMTAQPAAVLEKLVMEGLSGPDRRHCQVGR